MKRYTRILGIFMLILLVLTSSVLAAETDIFDLSTADQGTFTVRYNSDLGTKMKVGVTMGGSTVYHDYTPGTAATYAFTRSGNYTLTLYRNLSGTSYTQVASTSVSVQLEDAMTGYLVSTTEITFSEDDAVSRKAAELCNGLTTEQEKIVALHNFIAKEFTYDRAFALKVRTGMITTYTPDTNQVLAAEKGVCYDFSALFAALCRSQGIPCAVATGYLSGAYHAWNMVYTDNQWVAVDLTNAVTYRLYKGTQLSDCTVSLQNYSNYTY